MHQSEAFLLGVHRDPSRNVIEEFVERLPSAANDLTFR